MGVGVSRTVLCWLYAAIALLALVATWHQNAAYFRSGDVLGATVQFWRETLVTPASVSIMVDIFLFGLAVVLWMVVEARRLEIRYLWLYVVGAMLIAISVTVPLFLIARERRLAALRPDLEYDVVRQGDLIGLVLFALPILVLVVWSFLH